MKKLSFIDLISGLVLLLVLLMLSCGKKQPQMQMPAPAVDVVSVTEMDVTNYAELVGQVYGYQDIEIRARVDGFLEGIHFKEGFPVKKGQLLYTIDSQPYKAEVSSQQSKLAEAKTELAKAQSDLNRYKPLAEAKAVSLADLDAAQAQYDAAVATVKAAEANLELAKINLSYTRIKSPIDGVIGKTQSEIGEYVGRSMNTIILNTVSKIEEIHVEFFLPENQYLLLVKNLEDARRIFSKEGKLELALGDGSIHKYKGSVNFVDRSIDANTGTILVQTSFKNPDLIIRPGQFAKVRIPIPTNNALVVPQKCIVELQGQYSVFVVNQQNKVESRQIKTGKKWNDWWIIESGVSAGEKVIIDGLQKVRNGLDVQVTEIEFKSRISSN